MRELTLKRFTILLSLLLFGVGATLVVGGLYASDRLNLVRTAWNDFLLSSSEKSILEGHLRLSLGYGGMIHSFKNYLIRGESALLFEARLNLKEARDNLSSYRSLQISRDEKQAIDILENTLIAYEQAMKVAENLSESATNLYVIDTMAQVDDEPAFSALDRLHKESLKSLKLSSDENNKSFLLARLRSHLGYGGLIHAFKNYLIRGSVKYSTQTRASAQDAKALITSYRQQDLNPAEQEALVHIEATIHLYLDQLAPIKKALAKNRPVYEIDQQVKINDNLALGAFHVLENQILAQRAEKSRSVDLILGQVEQLGSWIVLLITVSFGLIMGFLIWLFQYVINKPLHDMTRALNQLAKGHYDTELPDHILITELNAMNKSAVVFRNTALRQMEADRAVSEAHKQITQSVRYASRIQKSLLPAEDLFKEHFHEYFIIWEPRDMVGGDLYWFRADRRGVMMAVFDCTGHGVPGALMTTIAVSALNRGYATTMDPGRLISFVNKQIKSALKQDSDCGLSDDGLEIGICLIERERAKMSFAGARFELFELKKGEIKTYKGTKSGVGYRKTHFDQKFPATTLKLEPQATYYLFSDGLTDQIGGEKNRMFGKKRLKEALLSFEEIPLKFQEEALLKTFKNYQGDQARRDDLSVIGFKPLG